MILVLSDREIKLNTDGEDINYFNLSEMKISNCTGCFCCWVKTPGKCVIRDDAVKIYPIIAKSDRLIYVSRIKYGSYDSPLKTMLERAIPVQQAFIRIHGGETHHVQRNVVPKTAKIVIYGDPGEKDKEVFRKLVARNALNMSFENYEIIFCCDEKVEDVVNGEVQKWLK